MTSWLPGRGSSLGEGEELASAPPFEGEIVKPSAQATPYPTTSTPQGYVVPEANEATPPALVSTSQPPADAAVATSTPPITYGMKPAEVAAISGASGAAAAIAPGAGNLSAADTIAAQEGPYAPLTGSGPAATATPPADTVVAGFSAAGGTSAGAYPPEQTVGLAPPASETVSMPAAPAGYGSQPTTPAAAPSAFATSPAAAAAGILVCRSRSSSAHRWLCIWCDGRSPGSPADCVCLWAAGRCAARFCCRLICCWVAVCRGDSQPLWRTAAASGCHSGPG